MIKNENSLIKKYYFYRRHTASLLWLSRFSEMICLPVRSDQVFVLFLFVCFFLSSVFCVRTIESYKAAINLK